MPIAFGCPSCGIEYEVNDQFAGKRTKCPACAESLIVPAESTLVRAPAAPTASPEDEAYALLSDGAEEPASSGPTPAEARSEAWDPGPAAPRTKSPLTTMPAPKPELKKSRKGSERGGRPRIYISPGVMGGIGSMVLAAIWFVAGLAADRIFLYPPIMFVLGFVAVIRGLLGHAED